MPQPERRKNSALEFIEENRTKFLRDPHCLAEALCRVAEIGTIAERGNDWSRYFTNIRQQTPANRVVVHTALTARWTELFAKTSRDFKKPTLSPSNIVGATVVGRNGGLIAAAANLDLSKYDPNLIGKIPNVLVPLIGKGALSKESALALYYRLKALSREMSIGRIIVPRLAPTIEWYATHGTNTREGGFIFTAWSVMQQDPNVNYLPIPATLPSKRPSTRK